MEVFWNQRKIFTVSEKPKTRPGAQYEQRGHMIYIRVYCILPVLAYCLFYVIRLRFTEIRDSNKVRLMDKLVWNLILVQSQDGLIWVIKLPNRYWLKYFWWRLFLNQLAIHLQEKANTLFTQTKMTKVYGSVLGVRGWLIL